VAPPPRFFNYHARGSSFEFCSSFRLRSDADSYLPTLPRGRGYGEPIAAHGGFTNSICYRSSLQFSQTQDMDPKSHGEGGPFVPSHGSPVFN
jgi:hypothetical protein